MMNSVAWYPTPDPQRPGGGTGSCPSKIGGAGAGGVGPLSDMDLMNSVNLSVGGAFDPTDNSGLPDSDWFSSGGHGHGHGPTVTNATLGMSPRVMTPLDMFAEGPVQSYPATPATPATVAASYQTYSYPYPSQPPTSQAQPLHTPSLPHPQHGPVLEKSMSGQLGGWTDWDRMWTPATPLPIPTPAGHELNLSSSLLSPISDSDSSSSQPSPTPTRLGVGAVPLPLPVSVPAPVSVPPRPQLKTEPHDPLVDDVSSINPLSALRSGSAAAPSSGSLSPRARHRSVEAKRRAKEMAAMNELMELHRQRHQHDLIMMEQDEKQEQDEKHNKHNKHNKNKGKTKQAKVKAPDKAAVLAETAQVIKALSARVAELTQALQHQPPQQSTPSSSSSSSSSPLSGASSSSSSSSSSHTHKRKPDWDWDEQHAQAQTQETHMQDVDTLELDTSTAQRGNKARLLDPHQQQQVAFIQRWDEENKAQQTTQGQARSPPISGEWESDSSPSSGSRSVSVSPIDSNAGQLVPMNVVGSFANHVVRSSESVIDTALHEYMFRNASVSMVFVDMMGKLIDCNNAFESMAGVSYKKAYGKAMSALSSFIPAITGRDTVHSVLDRVREQQQFQLQQHKFTLFDPIADPMYPFPETVMGLRKLVAKKEQAVAVIHRSVSYGIYKEVRVVHWLVCDDKGIPYAFVGSTTLADMLFRGPVDAPETLARAAAARQHAVSSIEQLQQLLEQMPLPSTEQAHQT